MKHYCVTYYDGKGERYMYVQAKSINAAMAEANDLLRKNKVVGAAVRRAKHIKSEYVPTWAINKESLGSMSIEEFAKIYINPSPIANIPKAEFPVFQKGSKSGPIPASEVARIIKERR